MSIFTKDCPVCAASHPVHTVRCGCGYCFDPNKLDGVTQELEVIAQEERLYSEYLAARANQADQAMRAAKVAAAVDPGNNVKAAEALLAEQGALSTRAELDAQNQRAQAVGNRIKVVRSNRRNRRIAKSSSSTPRTAPPPSLSAALSMPVPTAAPAKPVAPKVAAPAPRPAPPAPKPVAPPAPKSVVTQFSPPAPMAQAKPKSVTTKPAAAPAPAPAPTLRAVPVAQPKPAPVAAPKPAPTVSRTATTVPMQAPPKITRDPTPAFRATQATRAEQVTPPAPAGQECPNCGGKVAARATRCRCGFEMPLSASQIPSLSMSAEDRAALMAALAPVGKDKA